MRIITNGTVALVLCLIGFSSVCQAACPDQWTNFDGDGTCLRIFEKPMTWENARSTCQEEDGDLVEPSSEEKELAIKELRSQDSVPHWIGIKDSNADGNLEHLNGTTITPITWSMPVVINGDKNGNCLALGRNVTNYERRDCNSDNYYICEMETDAMGKCMDGWRLYREEGVCLKSFPTRGVWDDGRTSCRKLGADLVKIWNKNKELFLRRCCVMPHYLRRNDDPAYWIGVTRDTDDGKLEYVDGTRLIPREPTPDDWSIVDLITGQQSDKCMELNKIVPEYQNDSCMITRFSICEVDTTVERCQEGWMAYPKRNGCFRFFKEGADWKAAQGYCMESGSKDLHNCSKEEADLLKDEILTDDVSSFSIGIQYLDEDGIPKYVKGSPPVVNVPVPEWHLPTLRVDKTIGRCVVLGIFNQGYKTIDCERNAGFICQREQETDESSECPPSWHYFERGESCLQLMRDKKEWEDSRTFCQLEGGDLVEIRDVDKLNFLNAAAGGVRFWIGVNQLYKGEEEMRDMTTPHAHWGSTEMEKCPAMDGVGGTVALMCETAIPYVCEIFPNDAAEIPEDDMETCRREFCICQKRNWSHFKQGGKYIKINKAAKDFGSSAWICENLGGQLLTNWDVDTQQFVRNMTESSDAGTMSTYWIGLRHNATANLWEWIDGTPLAQMQLLFNDKNKECVTVESGERGGMVAKDCHAKNYHLCEATEPCSAFPILSFNGERKLDQTEIVIVFKQVVKVGCHYQGYPHLVSEVVIICGEESSDNMASGKLSANMALLIDIRLHDKECVCRLERSDDDENVPETSIRFNVLTPPRLADGTYNNTYVLLPYRDNISFQVVIYSNPAPQNITMLRNESEMGWDLYKVTITPLNTSMYSIVDISIKNSDHNESIDYTLVMDNGVGDGLEFTFRVTESSNMSTIIIPGNQDNLPPKHGHPRDKDSEKTIRVEGFDDFTLHAAAKDHQTDQRLTIIIITVFTACLVAAFMAMFIAVPGDLERQEVEDERLYPMGLNMGDFQLDEIQPRQEDTTSVDESFQLSSLTHADMSTQKLE